MKAMPQNPSSKTAVKKSAVRMIAKTRFSLQGPYRAVFIFSYGGLFVSGAVWALLHYFFANQNSFVEIPHPWEPFCLKLHAAFGFGTLLVLGSLFPLHIVPAFQGKKNRPSGLLILSLNLLLIATGYGLYYAGGEKFRWLLHVAHLWVGLVFPALLLIHLFLGKRLYQK